MKAHRTVLLLGVLSGCVVEGHYVGFDDPPARLLTVQVEGTGAGAVSSEPDGLTCSLGVCSGEFAEGTVVRLFASATTGAFLGWDEACRGVGVCTVTMDREQAVHARFGTPGEALWVKQLGGVDSDSGEAIAIDGNGDLIAVGSFHQTTVVGAELTSQGASDLYVVKLASSTGNVIWARRFGGITKDSASGVAVDGAGNIYITGTFESAVDFGGGPVLAVKAVAVFVLKLDASGSFGWVRKVDGTDFSDRRSVIATDGSSVVVAGSYFGSIAIDATTLASTGTSTDLFVLEVSASTGETKWIKSFGGTSYDVPRGIAIDGSGNAVLAGKFSGAVNFGGGVLAAPDSVTSNGFLLKLSGASGAHLLSKRLGSSRDVAGAAIAVDPASNIIVAGDFAEGVDLGCGGLLAASQAGISDVFLAKYTQAGACVWAKGFGGVASASPGRSASAVTVNSAGDVAVAGAFCGSISLGGESLSSASACRPFPIDRGMDMFAARLAGDGTHLRSARGGGAGEDLGRGIAQGSDGRLFVTGQFSGFADFGGNATTAIGSTDTFIVGFDPL